MKKFVTILLTASLLIFLISFSVSPVLATENEYDWENVDWTSYDWHSFEVEQWDSLSDYLRTEADLDTLLYLDNHCASASFAELVSVIMRERFVEDPEAMLQAVAKAPESDQRHHIISILFGFFDRDEMASVLESVRLTGADKEAAYAVLEEMIAYAEEEYHLEIANPKTGDHMEIIAAVMILSAAGIVTLIGYQLEKKIML